MHSGTATGNAVMRIRICVAIMLALTVVPFGTASALRTFEEQQRTLELALANVSLPLDRTGSVIFRACPECQPDSVTIDTAASYRVNRSPVTFAQLREAAAEINRLPGGGDGTAVFLYIDLASGRLARIALSRPGYPAPYPER